LTKLIFSFVLLLSCTLSNAAQDVEPKGDIRGQVIFTGTKPAVENYAIGGDRFCEEANAKKPIAKDEVVINPNSTIANVVVWIAKGGPDWFYKSTGASQPPVVLDQRDCMFVPHVVAMQTGQKLVVKNSDKTLHNVNAQPENNPRLNKALIPGGEPAVLTFAKPEIAVKLKSDIHPWMTAWAAVFDHPGFAVTGEDGRFEIKGVPPGEYVLQAWHEKFGTISLPLLVSADHPANAVFTYTNQGSKGGTQVDANGNPTTGTVQQYPE
jgi:hypothetical protein